MQPKRGDVIPLKKKEALAERVERMEASVEEIGQQLTRATAELKEIRQRVEERRRIRNSGDLLPDGVEERRQPEPEPK